MFMRDRSLAHKKNNFQNKAIDLCTDKECRALLKAAMNRPVLSEVEREEVRGLIWVRFDESSSLTSSTQRTPSLATRRSNTNT